MAGLVLSARDRDLLEALTLRVRVLTLAQIARTWWGHTSEPTRAARQRLSDLKAAGLLEHVAVLAHPELPLSRPVYTWRPGDAPSGRRGPAPHAIVVRTPSYLRLVHGPEYDLPGSLERIRAERRGPRQHEQLYRTADALTAGAANLQQFMDRQHPGAIRDRPKRDEHD